MRLLTTLLILTFANALLSCSGSNDTASTKFITLDGLGGGLGNYLIKDVKETSWLIHYGFSDNDLCSSSDISSTQIFEQQIRSSILKAIGIWLQPLRALDTKIVNDFSLIRVKTEQSNSASGNTEHNLVRGDAKANIGFVFNCKERGKTSYPNSNASPWTRVVHMHHIYGQAGHFPNNKISDEHMFMMTSLLHEIGHIFGLADTYFNANPEQLNLGGGFGGGGGGVVETGDSEYTVGKQPLAIMGIANLIGVDPQPFITADDAEGIRWLYRLTHDNASVDECPENYVIEQETKGCLPRHPLIFAVRNGELRRAKALLQDSSIDINTCDQYGRNALFYAEQHKLRHGGNMVELLQDKGAKPNSTCPASKLLVNDASTSIAEVEAASVETQNSTAPAAKSSCGTIRHNSVSENMLLLLLVLFSVLTKIYANVVQRKELKNGGRSSA